MPSGRPKRGKKASQDAEQDKSKAEEGAKSPPKQIENNNDKEKPEEKKLTKKERKALEKAEKAKKKEEEKKQEEEKKKEEEKAKKKKEKKRKKEEKKKKQDEEEKKKVESPMSSPVVSPSPSPIRRKISAPRSPSPSPPRIKVSVPRKESQQRSPSTSPIRPKISVPRKESPSPPKRRGKRVTPPLTIDNEHIEKDGVKTQTRAIFDSEEEQVLREPEISEEERRDAPLDRYSSDEDSPRRTRTPQRDTDEDDRDSPVLQRYVAKVSAPRRSNREYRKRNVNEKIEYSDEEDAVRSRRRRSKPPPVDRDVDTEDEQLDAEEYDKTELRQFLMSEPTEEELQDEYRALLKRVGRLYPYLEIEIPPRGTPSRRLRRLYNYYVDEVTQAEGLEKYKIVIIIVAAVIESIGKKFNLPIDGYAKLQRDNMASYHAMLVELGDRHYFGFADSWPVEVRIGGMMLMNALFLVLGRLLLEGDTMNILMGAVQNNRQIPGPVLDNPAAAAQQNGGGSAVPSGGGNDMGGLGGLLGGLMGGGGGGGGLMNLIQGVMGGVMGGQGGPPAREREDQAAPTYSRRARRKNTEAD